MTGDVIETNNMLPPLVAQICKYIEKHLQEKITVEEMAKELHYNKDYMNRCFKKVMGTSLKEFILSKKLVRAQNLLCEGMRPNEVCGMLGFQNYANFSRTFTNYIGESPRKFREINLHL